MRKTYCNSLNTSRSIVFPTYLSVLLTICLTLPPVSAQSGSRDMVVNSRLTHSSKKYDRCSGAYEGDFVAPNNGSLQRPQEVVFGPDGHLIYICDWTQNRVNRYDLDGNFLEIFVSPGNGLANPNSITFGPPDAAVGSGIYIYQLRSGNLIQSRKMLLVK